MTLQDTTGLVIVAVGVILIAYDVWAKWKDPTGDSTISWVVLTESKKWPVVAFGFGFLMGHMFFQNCNVP